MAEEAVFVVRQDAFAGSLGELAHALRTRTLRPDQLDLLRLVRDYLTFFHALADRDLNLASAALPQVAQIVELKLRLLLPAPPRDPDETDEADLEDALEAIALLEDLQDAIDFLRQRREARRLVLPARAPTPDYPRVLRPLRVPIGKLALLAARHRASGYFELTVERLSVPQAMRRLMAALRRLRRATFGDVADDTDWPTRTVMFVGLLELIREGKVRARQEGGWMGEIEVEVVEGVGVEEAVGEVA